MCHEHCALLRINHHKKIDMSITAPTPPPPAHLFVDAVLLGGRVEAEVDVIFRTQHPTQLRVAPEPGGPLPAEALLAHDEAGGAEVVIIRVKLQSQRWGVGSSWGLVN